jgi:hypothetical protein
MGHLHAILAAESPAAILIKRGPGRFSCTIGWDRRSDTFQTGQWVRKKIYHDDADLSPDGEHFVCWVDSQHYGKEHGYYRAVSRAPWLKALMFWSSKSPFYAPGAGMFFRDVDGLLKLWARDHDPEWDHLGLKTTPELPDSAPWNRIKTRRNDIHTARLQRDGWVVVSPWEEAPKSESLGVARWREGCTQDRMILKKPFSEGWELRQTLWSGSNYDERRRISFEVFDLVSPAGEVERHPEWEWADVDSARNRLVWTDGCNLFAAGIPRVKGLLTTNLLLNTREMRYHPIKAPY